MPQVQLIPTGVANLGAGQVATNLVISAPFAGTCTVSVGGGVANAYALGAGGSIAIPVNAATVSVVNTTAGVLHPPAGNLVLNW